MKIQALTSFQGKSFLDKIHESTKNSADMTDSIVVPRTIFKGYLGIMGGTWAFVRPFIIKDAKGVEKYSNN